MIRTYRSFCLIFVYLADSKFHATLRFPTRVRVVQTADIIAEFIKDCFVFVFVILKRLGYILFALVCLICESALIFVKGLLMSFASCHFVMCAALPTHNTEQGAFPKNVFMVFEYLEYDLTGVLETPEIRLTQDHIKSWSQQLLSGCHYMHINKVIHRDLKASNLLINRKGELKIADWGLARSWNSEMKRLTNKVITLWYRPPELLLGCVEYTTQIDMWSVGCIIAEMFRRSGFLKGANEAGQLDLIFKTCGHPTKENWPDIHKQCRLWKRFEPGPGKKRFPNRLAEALRAQLPHPRWMTDEAVKLISKLMELNPETRWSALQALDADYFFESPIVKEAKDLAMRFAVTSVHEMDCRRKYEQKIAQHKAMQAMAAANGKRNPPLPPPK